MNLYLVFILFFTTISSTYSSESSPGRFVVLAGKTQIIRGGTTKNLQMEDELFEGDKLIVGADGLVIVRLADYSTVKFESNTVVVVDTLIKKTRVGEFFDQSRFKVNYGTVVVDIVKLFNGPPTFELETAKDLLFAAKGTQFSLSVTKEQDNISLYVNEGIVRALDYKNDDSESVSTGKGMVVGDKGELSIPQKYKFSKYINWNSSSKDTEFATNNDALHLASEMEFVEKSNVLLKRKRIPFSKELRAERKKYEKLGRKPVKILDRYYKYLEEDGVNVEAGTISPERTQAERFCESHMRRNKTEICVIRENICKGYERRERKFTDSFDKKDYLICISDSDAYKKMEAECAKLNKIRIDLYCQVKELCTTNEEAGKYMTDREGIKTWYACVASNPTFTAVVKYCNNYRNSKEHHICLPTREGCSVGTTQLTKITGTKTGNTIYVCGGKSKVAQSAINACDQVNKTKLKMACVLRMKTNCPPTSKQVKTFTEDGLGGVIKMCVGKDPDFKKAKNICVKAQLGSSKCRVYKKSCKGAFPVKIGTTSSKIKGFNYVTCTKPNLGQGNAYKAKAPPAAFKGQKIK